MDIYKVIHDLMQEKKRLDAVIASLETRSNGSTRTKSRRGRKSMNAEERAAVSRRMAAYWAARRGQQTNNASAKHASSSDAPTSMPPVIELARAAASGYEASLA